MISQEIRRNFYASNKTTKIKFSHRFCCSTTQQKHAANRGVYRDSHAQKQILWSQCSHKIHVKAKIDKFIYLFNISAMRKSEVAETRLGPLWFLRGPLVGGPLTMKI